MNSVENVHLYVDPEDEKEKEGIPDLITHELIMKQVDMIYERMSEAIGHGKTAEVVHIPRGKSNVCYKIIAQSRLEELYESPLDIPQCNSPEIEADFLELVREIPSRVKVPKPLCFWEGESNALGHFKVLVFEKLNAFTVQDLLMNQERLNPDFDIQAFSQDLLSFVEKMNEAGIHHKDITVTNIMIDRETNKPCVIDFGDSEKEFGYEEKKFTKDKVAAKDVVASIRNHLLHQIAK